MPIRSFLLALILSGLPMAGLAQCTKDTDCKGARICEQGRCVNPGQIPSAPSASADKAQVPKFAAYPAKEAYQGKNAPLLLETEQDKTFKTRLKEAAGQKPNFAGHYILTAWGCGSECLMGAAIDANTGKVHWLPHTLCCWGSHADGNFEPIVYRPNSRLIVFAGLRDEQGENGVHFYEFDQGRFIHLQTVGWKP